MSVRAVLLLLVLVLPLVGHARAQEDLPTGRVDAAFRPATMDVPLGGVANASLRVQNGKLQPVSLVLSLVEDARYRGQLSKTELLLAPTANETILLHAFPSAALPPGPLNVTVRIVERAAPGVPAGEATLVNLTLRLVNAPLPAGSPLVSPRVLEAVALERNQSANVTVPVRHDGPQNATYRLRAFTPAGWLVTAPPVVVPRGETRTLTLHVNATFPQNGTALLVLESTSNASLATVLDLPLVGKQRPPPSNPMRPPPPQEEPSRDPDPDAGGTPPPPDSSGSTDEPAADDASPQQPLTNDTRPEDPAEEEATEPAPERAANATAPAAEAAPAPAPAPPEEDAASLPPAAEERDATPLEERPTPAPRVEEEPRAPPTLRVEPRLLRVAPGGIAEARLVVTSERDARVPLRLDLPVGLTSDLLDRVVLVKAGEPLTVPFLVEADPRLAHGTRLDARVVSGGHEAAFVVLVEVAFEPVELVSLSAPTSAGGQGMGGTSLPLVLAGIGVAALAVARTRKRWLALAAVLYARLRPQAVLEHPMRQRLVALAEAQPGQTIRDLQRDLGLANGAMTYHLRTLEKAGIVRVVPDGQMRRVYPATHARVAPVPPLADRILQHVRENGEASTKDLSEALGATRQAIHYHVQRLTREGKLRATVMGREARFRAPEAAPARPPRPTGT